LRRNRRAGFEPSKNEWQGEVFNDQALAQFKKLGKIFQDSERLTFESLGGIIAEDARTLPLVPANLETTFDDRTFLIRRESTGTNPPTQIPLSEAFARLLEPFERNSDLRSKFKIFTVQVNDGRPECEAFVQITGTQKEDRNRSLTRQARWRCFWDWPDSSKPPLLRSVQLSEFEETAAKPLFIDCSDSVFKNVASYQNQFLRGAEHWAGRIESRYGIGISGWHGMALGDANGDGLDDLRL